MKSNYHHDTKKQQYTYVFSTSNLRKAHETRNSLSNSCSKTVLVYPQSFRLNSPLSVHRSRKSQKTLKPFFLNFKSFKVIDVNTAKQLVASACYDKQHVYAYLQLFSL